MKQFKISVTKLTDSSPSLNRFFSEISKNKLLSAEEEAELAFRAKAGDEKARELVIKSNLRFVISVAKQYVNKNASLEDLISEGNKGIVEAIDKFDPSTGFKFISYAVWHIRKNIYVYMSDFSRQIRIPLNVVTDIRKFERMEEDFISNTGRTPNTEEIIELLEQVGNPISKNAQETVKNSPRTVPLTPENNDENNFGPINFLSSEEEADKNIINESRSDLIDLIMKKLSQIEKEVVLLKYGINKGQNEYSYTQIADKYGKTPEWARKTAQKAVKKLKYSFIKNKISGNDLN
jgi:RNA polymerase primary sigma factor